MDNEEIRNCLAKFGYTNSWLDYGILTLEQLSNQEQMLKDSDDQNTEHYRYQTLTQFLSSKKALTDLEFDHYLDLTFSDRDQVMAGTATVDIFKFTELTDSQFINLCKSIIHFGEWTNRVVKRYEFLRQLKSTELTNDFFRKCIELGDSVIHEALLEIANFDQLQDLALKGASKKVKHLAKVRADRMKR